MYNMNTPWWNIVPFRTTPQQSTYTVYAQVPIYLGGAPGTERVVIYRSSDGSNSRAEIQRLDETSLQWIVEYTKDGEGIPYFSVTYGYWELLQRNVAILYSIVGSGGFLSYWVIGRKDGGFSEFVERKDIFQGNVWLEGGQLFESEASRFRIWTLKNGKLVLAPYSVPILPESVVIEFSISPSGKVRIRRRSYTIPVGGVVQILRTDSNQISERILTYADPGTADIAVITHRNAYRFLTKGQRVFTIIPGGYDWDHAVDVTVTAQ